ncbi:aspartic proteinase-like protein 2 isoform X1 [Cajanus cajan]|uniref:Aspartic proteinase-like protein 2 n=1 Tax=Cajanus cajan TaxID=3821 RepID=A0A151TNL5_CAJCA|nr:aspartic proteinase-like protein 2 isoform X1 [Cajanus cajan]KYP68621.1 Aspartic proteinase-like protein 2 [Cajanus cajan]
MAAAFLFAAALLAAVSASPVTLTLERAFPSDHGVELSQLRAWDSLRHRRMLQSTNYVVNFPVKGTFDPSQVGLYFTKVKLGTPPREFYVQIDTGSDVLWVSCGSCNGCPQTSGLPIQLNYFDPGSSSTSSLISCSDRRCRNGVQSSDASCSGQSNQCTYTFQYGDGSGTSGYYVSDLMHFASIFEGSLTTNSSASVVFGCSNQQTGDLTKSDRAVDGIFGFGQQGLSVISQLSSQGIAPRVFSHCLKGDNSGGGVLVLGEIVEPNIVFSPLVPSQPHYNLNLQSISVNGQILPIDPAVFATSNNRGTIVDSGTTLAYLAEEAYNPFVNAITAAIPQSVRSVLSRGNQCYLITTSSNVDIFPQVSLNFAGGASLVLRPQDYLMPQNYIGEGSVWCIGFQKIPGQSVTILGDLVLKDKIFVYDLAGQRIGWANYDCSLPVNVSASAGRGRSEFVDAGEINGSTCSRDGPHMLIKTLFLALFMHITLFL